MSTSRGRSLSERLDRDGIEAVLRKAKDVGGDAPGIAEKYAALQRGFDALRSLDRKTGGSEEDLAAALEKIESRRSGTCCATNRSICDSAASLSLP